MKQRTGSQHSTSSRHHNPNSTPSPSTPSQPAAPYSIYLITEEPGRPPRLTFAYPTRSISAASTTSAQLQSYLSARHHISTESTRDEALAARHKPTPPPQPLHYHHSSSNMSSNNVSSNNLQSPAQPRAKQQPLPPNPAPVHATPGEATEAKRREPCGEG